MNGETMRRGVLTLGAGLALLAGSAGALSAQAHLGAQGSFADDFDFGIGGRVVLDLTPLAEPFELSNSFDLFFPDGDVDYWELNSNLIYNFGLPKIPTLVPYAGAGLNVAHIDLDNPDLADDDDTKIGVNFLGGAKFPLQSVTPFVELRVEAEGGEQVVITAGVLFP